MASLIAASRWTFMTDFAFLAVRQRDVDLSVTTPSFAHSTAGTLEMACGAKYAYVDITVEVWDGEAPRRDGLWEDVDIVPWRNVPGGGPLEVRASDHAIPGMGPDVAALDRGLAEVLATGRHRYSYSSFDTDDLPPEQWLVRLWPVPEPVEALALPPRHTAGPGPAGPLADPWGRAQSGWYRGGWWSYLNE